MLKQVILNLKDGVPLNLNITNPRFNDKGLREKRLGYWENVWVIGEMSEVISEGQSGEMSLKKYPVSL
jgi:hypothetical protein